MQQSTTNCPQRDYGCIFTGSPSLLRKHIEQCPFCQILNKFSPDKLPNPTVIQKQTNLSLEIVQKTITQIQQHTNEQSQEFLMEFSIDDNQQSPDVQQRQRHMNLKHQETSESTQEQEHSVKHHHRSSVEDSDKPKPKSNVKQISIKKAGKPRAVQVLEQRDQEIAVLKLKLLQAEETSKAIAKENQERQEQLSQRSKAAVELQQRCNELELQVTKVARQLDMATSLNQQLESKTQSLNDKNQQLYDDHQKALEQLTTSRSQNIELTEDNKKLAVGIQRLQHRIKEILEGDEVKLLKFKVQQQERKLSVIEKSSRAASAVLMRSSINNIAEEKRTPQVIKPFQGSPRLDNSQTNQAVAQQILFRVQASGRQKKSKIK